MKRNPRQSLILLDSTTRIPGILGTGFQIPVAGGIPDSLSCIPDFKIQDFQNSRTPLRGTMISDWLN